MEERYSPLSKSAAQAISSNGFGILKMPKYSSKIAVTHVRTLSKGMVSVRYLDKDGQLIAGPTSGLREWYPMIGEIEEEKS